MDKQTLLILSAAVMALVTIGAVYFVKVPVGTPLLRRLVTSAYAPVIGATFMFVAIAWPDSHRFNDQGVKLLLQLQLAPLLLLFASLGLYQGPKSLHLLLVPISLCFWLWFFAMSWIHVRGM